MEHAPSTQTPKYDRVSLLSIAILLVLTWGFYKTYIILFPSFEGFQFVHHFHGAIMLLWIGALIIQPWLISRKKYRIHKAIGKISFVLAPILMISIFLVSRNTFHLTLNAPSPLTEAIAIVSLSIPAVFIFGILYGLAIANKARTFYHMRYMIGTGLLMIGPGLGRGLIVYFGMQPPFAISITLLAVALISALFLVADIAKKRDYKPNLIVVTMMFLYLACWELRYTTIWQAFGEAFTKWFF
jgi:hypothetical protein